MHPAVTSRLRPFKIAFVLTGALLCATHAMALSDVGSGPAEAENAPVAAGEAVTEGNQLPMPGALIDRSATGNSTADDADDHVVAEISHDISRLPEPVRRIRELIVEAAASGDVSRLRMLMNPGPDQVQITGGEDQDPLDALKAFSGDPDGLEVLAIILDLLSTGYAHMDVGTPEEVYVWPYFAGKPLAELTAPEKVELLRIITAGDLADMQEYGNYSFYRIGISPSGEWKFFSAGD